MHGASVVAVVTEEHFVVTILVFTVTSSRSLILFLVFRVKHHGFNKLVVSRGGGCHFYGG